MTYNTRVDQQHHNRILRQLPIPTYTAVNPLPKPSGLYMVNLTRYSRICKISLYFSQDEDVAYIAVSITSLVCFIQHRQ